VIAVVNEAMLNEPWFGVLGAFVAFNTVVYVSMALGKLWPKRRR
jgi:hypothetical protein